MTKIEVLKNCTVESNIVKLPSGQLDRKLYQEVAKALELIGGKWKGGKIMGFVFISDPTELLASIANGNSKNIKKEVQFFATPDGLADLLVQLANIEEIDAVLEPSAGHGAIIKAINKTGKTPDCYEILDTNRIVLNNSGLKFNLIGEDFLKNTGKVYRKIIANPPFSKNQDIDHITEMYKVLSPGGSLVSIASQSWVNGSQKKQVAFKEWLKEIKAEIIDIEPGSFKESGTMVGAKIINIYKSR